MSVRRHRRGHRRSPAASSAGSGSRPRPATRSRRRRPARPLGRRYRAPVPHARAAVRCGFAPCGSRDLRAASRATTASPSCCTRTSIAATCCARSASHGSRSTPSPSPASAPSMRAGCSTTCSARSRAARSRWAICSSGSPPSSRWIPSGSGSGRSREPSRTRSGATRSATTRREVLELAAALA